MRDGLLCADPQDDDIDKGSFKKHSIRDGQGPDNEEVTGTDSDTQTLPKTATLTLAKTGTYVDHNGDNKNQCRRPHHVYVCC